MPTSAKMRNVRISPQKARLVADLVRGLPVDRALGVLTFSNKKAAGIIKKVLDSAIANAEHNDGADIDELKVSVDHRRPGGLAQASIGPCPWPHQSDRETHEPYHHSGG